MIVGIRIVFFYLLCYLAVSVNAQSRTSVFNEIESYDYGISVWFLKAGECQIRISADRETIANRSCRKISVRGYTTGIVSLTHTVDDVWESYVDENNDLPVKFYRKIHENTYHCEETTLFDFEKAIAYLNHSAKKIKSNELLWEKVRKKEIPITNKTQELVSGFFKMRSIAYSQMQPMDSFCIDGFLEKNYPLNFVYEGKEKLDTHLGEMNTIKISPILPKNKIFDEGKAIKIWLSNDRNRVPLKIKAKFFLGSANVELVRYKIQN